jgi:uncharacterized membrane protein YfbV (UPF0208 family)
MGRAAMTRLPTISHEQYCELHAKLVEAGQVLASEQYKPPHKSVQQLIREIRKEKP